MACFSFSGLLFGTFDVSPSTLSSTTSTFRQRMQLVSKRGSLAQIGNQRDVNARRIFCKLPDTTRRGAGKEESPLAWVEDTEEEAKARAAAAESARFGWAASAKRREAMVVRNNFASKPYHKKPRKRRPQQTQGTSRRGNNDNQKEQADMQGTLQLGEEGKKKKRGPIPPGASKKLFSDLKSAKTPDQVLRACGEFGTDRVTGKNAALALHRLATIARHDMKTDHLERRMLARRSECREILDRLVECSQRKKGVLSGGDACTAVRALANLNAAVLYPGYVDVLASHAITTAKDNPEFQVEEVLRAQAQARHKPCYLVECCAHDWLLNTLGPQGLATLQPSRATSLLWAAANLYEPSDLSTLTPVLISLVETWEPVAADFRPGQIATCLWSLAVMDRTGCPAFQSLWRELARSFKSHSQTESELDSNLSQSQLSQVHQAVMSFEMDQPSFYSELISEQGSQELRAGAAKAWERTLSAQKTVSSYQRGIEKALLVMGVKYRMEVPSGGYSIDIALTHHGVALEADGPSHVFHNSPEPLGPTQLKHRHLKALGWKVLSIPYQDWDMLLDNSSQSEYIEERLLELNQRVTPAYGSQG